MLTCPSCGNCGFIQPMAFMMSDHGELQEEIDKELTPIRCANCLSPVGMHGGLLILLGRGL